MYIPPDLMSKMEAQKKMKQGIQQKTVSKAKSDIERLKASAMKAWETPPEGEQKK